MTNAIKPPRGAWHELRAYRNACDEYTALLARDAREWRSCAVGYEMTLTIAARERYALHVKAMQWAATLCWRALEHAEADDGVPAGERFLTIM